MKNRDSPGDETDLEKCNDRSSLSYEVAAPLTHGATASKLREGAAIADAVLVQPAAEFEDRDVHQFNRDRQMYPRLLGESGVVASIFVAMAANRFKVGLERRRARYMQQCDHGVNHYAAQWQADQLPQQHATVLVPAQGFSHQAAQWHVDQMPTSHTFSPVLDQGVLDHAAQWQVRHVQPHGAAPFSWGAAVLS